MSEKLLREIEGIIEKVSKRVYTNEKNSEGGQYALNVDDELTKFIHTLIQQEVLVWKEKCEILEKEREDWWSKAANPDECYIPIPAHEKIVEREMRKANDALNIAKQCIEHAIYDENGLDGCVGQKALKRIEQLQPEMKETNIDTK